MGLTPVSTPYAQEISRICVEWNAEVDRIYARRVGPPLARARSLDYSTRLWDRDVMSVPQAASLEIFTSCGVRAIPKATTLSTDIPAWATRSPVDWA